MVSDVLRLLDDVFIGVSAARRLLAFWGPVTPVPALIAPLVAIASVLTLALLSGVAVACLALLIVALVALYLVLTEVFGVTVDVAVA